MYTPVSFHKTRIAPTPSGFLHLGNVLSFAITAALARKTGAKILLRIDDLDRERVNPLYVQDIFDTLHFLEIPWDEGPRDLRQFEQEYSQLHRMELYQQALQQLAASNAVFGCTCSRSRLQQSEGVYPGTCIASSLNIEMKDINWRLHAGADKKVQVKTWPAMYQQHTLPADMQYFVVKKKDGFPAYQLASLLDDLHFGVDLVVRGEDLWPSTIAQLYLASLLQYEHFLESTFYHHPLLMKNKDSKLSKSAGDTSVQYLRRQGYSASEVYTMIAGMLDHPEPVNNWQQLAALLVNR
ncbi:MAG: glutamate--tRNA ligase family protein [Chitinophagaceae bacterium]